MQNHPHHPSNESLNESLNESMNESSNPTHRSSKSSGTNRTHRSTVSNVSTLSYDSVESSATSPLSDSSESSAASSTSIHSTLTSDSSKKKPNDGLRLQVTMTDPLILGLVNEPNEVLLQLTVLSLAGNCTMLTHRVCVRFSLSSRPMDPSPSRSAGITQTKRCIAWSPGSSPWPSCSPRKWSASGALL